MLDKFFLTIFLFTLASCTTPQRVQRAYNEKLFPDGIYRQNIQLEIFKKSKVVANLPLETVSRIQNGDFEVLGLSPFGTSIFEAKGHIDRPDDLDIRFFVERPTFLKDEFIKDTLAKINDLYRLKESDLTKEDGKDTYRKEPVYMEIFKYNSKSIPSFIRLTTPQWRVHVQNQSYKEIH